METGWRVEEEAVVGVAAVQVTGTLHSTFVSTVTDSAQSDVQEMDVEVVLEADEETTPGNPRAPASTETPCDSVPMHEGAAPDDPLAYHLSSAISAQTAVR